MARCVICFGGTANGCRGRLDGWLANTLPNPQSPTLIHDFGELREERVKADTPLEQFSTRIDEGWLGETLTWYSGAAKNPVSMGKRALMVHLFNHQTHHRGQAHAALTIHGIDPGDTDILLVVPNL